MKPANYAPIYCAMYPKLAEIARKHGYALAVHGSMGRDFDLICIPWTDSPATSDVVVAEIEATFHTRCVGGPPDFRAHGRQVWTLSIGFGECFLDLSFMPLSRPTCFVCGGVIKHHEGGVCKHCHIGD